MPSPSTKTSFTYGLLRHGETFWNHEKRVQGHGNSPLTEAGKLQISNWAKHLNTGDWQHILCSDLGRVQETVAILNTTLDLPVTIDKRLREQNWGAWEGLKVSDVYSEWPDELAIQSTRGWDFCPPQGESRKDVRDRAFEALAESRTTISAKNLLIVCHLGVIKCLVYSVAGRKFMPDEPTLIEKGCMHHLHYSSSEYRLGTLNISTGNVSP